MSKIYYDSTGKKVELGQELGRGGEGTVYSCAGRDDVVGKIYHSKIDPEKQTKLRLMSAQTNPKLLAISAWIVDTLHDRPGGETVGFVMPSVKAKEIHQLYSLKSRRVHFPNSDWRFLIHTAINLAKAVFTVHSQNLVIGDVNHGNFVVLPDGIVKLIDCDSYHFEHAGEVYPCEVGMTTHLPPELQGRSLRGVERIPAHDEFGLAVVIFQLLFLGRHPFSGNYIGAEDKTLEESIREKLFAYGSGAAARMVRQPPGTLHLEAVSGPVAELFIRSFLTEDKRPSAAEWIDGLNALSKQLTQCKENVGHHYLRTLSRCPWCEIEVQTGIALFPVGFGQQETTGFNVLTIEELLKSINIPSKLALTPMKQLYPPSLSPELQPARDESMLRIGLSALIQAMLVGVLVSLTEPAGTCLGVFLIVLVASVATPSNRGLRAELQRKRDDEMKNWEALETEWKTVEDTEPYNDTKVRIRNRLKEYKELPQLRIERLKNLRNDRYQKLLNEYLDKFRIDEADIKGIGETRTSVLLSLGVRTAADVKASRILGVSGFGNAHTDKLVDWRRELEKKFQVDPGRLVVTADEKRSVEIEIVKLKARYEREIQDSTKLLRTRVKKLGTTYDELRTKNTDLGLALAQAERNLRAIDTRITSALVSIAVGIGIFVAGSMVESAQNRSAYESQRANAPYVTTAPGQMTKEGPVKPPAPQSVYESNPDPDPGLPGARPYDEILLMTPSSREYEARLLRASGVLLVEKKDYKAATIKFREAIRHWAEGPETYYELGSVLRKMDRHNESVRAFEKGVAQNAKYKDIKELLGFAYISTQDWEEAKYIFGELYGDHLYDHKYAYNLGLAHRKLKETSQAITMLEWAAELNSADPKTRYELGMAFVDAGRFLEAERELKRLMPLNDRLSKDLRTNLDSAKNNY